MKSKIHECQNKYISMRKNSITIFITLLITALSFAQQGINYKAILKDTNGNVLANTFMNVQFTIHQATTAGTIVYQEDHNYTTGPNGLLILTIGTDSSPSVGTFATINWSIDLHFLQTTITYSGGTINFDATQFMAVPYALHAKSADGGVTSLNDLSDAKSDDDLVFPGSSIFLGNLAGSSDDGTNNRNVGVGFKALSVNTAGGFNTAVGSEALSLNETGGGNTAIGTSALRVNTTGGLNTAIGSSALSANTTGTKNTAVGQDALEKNFTGNNNIAIGEDALEDNRTGNSNTAIGEEAMDRNTSGSSNTAIGNGVLDFNTTGNFNIAIGANAGIQNSTGSNNIFIGSGTGSSLDLSDKLYIKSLIYGEFDTDLVRINGTLDVTEEINREVTGDANLVPIAYGTIESNANVLSGTGNFTASISANVISINVNNETLNVSNTSCLITPYSTSFRSSSIIISDGDIQVRTFNSSGNLAPVTFQFAIYKL